MFRNYLFPEASKIDAGKKSQHASYIKVMSLLFGLMLGLGLTAQAFAQGGARGAIAGSVKDPSGAAINKAQVQVINKQTGATERTVTTNADGSFNATLLPIGIYRVVITATGFSKLEAEDVKVSVTETTNLPVTLKVGAVTEAVTIEGGATIVQLSSPATGQTIQNVGDLPLSTRNFLSLLALSTGSNSELADTAALGRGAVSINVNGQRPVNNNFQLEGINANDINLPIFDNVPLPNPQTIAEFKTQTSLYDASQGRNGGGNIQAALKSGASAYHGDAYEFFRNNVFNATDFFQNRDGLDTNSDGKADRPVLRQNQFGGSLGGPVPVGSIFKNSFFFGNYQGTRATSGTSAGTTISTNIRVIPTVRTAANLQATFFPGGLPPGFTALDPTALAFLNLPASKCPVINDGTFCIPTVTPSDDNPAIGLVSRNGIGKYTDDQFTITGDKQLTDKDKLSLRFFYSDNNLIQPFGIASSLSFQKDLPGVNRFAKIGWTRVFSERMVNDFRFGFNRFGFDQIPTEPIQLTDIGGVRGNSGQFPAAYRVAVGGVGSFQIGTAVNDDRGGRFNTFTFGDDFSINSGRHQFRMGGDLSRYQLNRYNNFSTRGSVTFNNTGAVLATGFPALSGFQNFLLGRVTGTQGAAGFSNFYFRATDMAAYFQDDWKIKSRLTLNLGVRWEGLSTATEKFNFLANFQGLGDGQPGPIKIIHPEATANVGTPGVSRCTLLRCFDKNNFAPRVGFAWDLFGDQKTALRGGAGIYYQRVSNQPLLQASGGLPFQQQFSASLGSVSFQNPFPSIRPISDFPLSTDQQVPTLIAFDGTTGAPIFSTVPGVDIPGAPLSGFFFFPERDFRAPYAQQWNLTIQREFIKDWAFEVGYVGTRGVGLIGPGRALNASQICTIASPCIIPSSIGSSVTVPAGTPGVTKNTDGSIAITSSTLDNVDARVPVQFMGLANNRGAFQEQSGASTYHSLQASVTHRFTRGLYFQGAYTLSKSFDNSSGSAFGDELNGLIHSGDLQDIRSNRGLSDFDRTHRVVFSYVVDLPFSKLVGVENKGIGKLAHGWALNGSTIFQSGTPFLIIDTGQGTLQDPDLNNFFNRASLAPGSTLTSVLTTGDVRSRLNNYVNLGGFLDRTTNNCVNNQNVAVSCTDDTAVAGAIGSMGRNVLRGPFQQNWDMSLVKKTNITESKLLEIRGEFFNIWNHAAFQSPQAALGAFGNYGIVDVAGQDSSILGTANRPRIIQFVMMLKF